MFTQIYVATTQQRVDGSSDAHEEWDVTRSPLLPVHTRLPEASFDRIIEPTKYSRCIFPPKLHMIIL